MLDDKKRFPSSQYSWSSTVAKQIRHPSILHTSRKARAEGLRHYELCRENSKASSNSQRRRGVYWWRNVISIKFAVDVFHLKSPKQAGDPPNGPDSVNTYNFEPDLLRWLQHFAPIYSTEAYSRPWTPSNLLKAASIHTFMAIFPEGFTGFSPMASIQGDCLDKIRGTLLPELWDERDFIYFLSGKWRKGMTMTMTMCLVLLLVLYIVDGGGQPAKHQ